MFHCFVPEAGPGIIRITGKDMHHIKNVLRMKQGEALCVSNGRDLDFYCTVIGFEDDAVLVQTDHEAGMAAELPSDIILYQGLPKADKMEFIIQKAVELGAAGIVPVAMKRSVVKLDEKKQEKKLARWQSIAESAAGQCGRVRVPEIYPVCTIAQAVENVKTDADMILVPYESAEGMQGTKRALEDVRPGMKIAVFIGPEGGFESAEIEMLKEAGAGIVSLGHRILRTETAGLAAITMLMIRLEMIAEEY
ncbi:MAG: 16S rRNA (uracil(1498)-N(3))-methyltransferase [Lachnospiraceae bacterium]|nr:16S rRNA (uracil(1498)-N(3))-methyltransferase [Lachnospiraceae bacterium]